METFNVLLARNLGRSDYDEIQMKISGLSFVDAVMNVKLMEKYAEYEIYSMSHISCVCKQTIKKTSQVRR